MSGFVKALCDKMFGEKVNTTPTTANVQTIAAPITTGIIAQPANQWAGAHLGVGNAVYQGGGGVAIGGAPITGVAMGGGNYQISPIGPNFVGNISISGSLKMDPDASITGVPSFHRVPFDTRTEKDVEAYYGDGFKMGEELFPTNFDLSEGKNEFHFLVWYALWGDTVRDYGFLMLKPKKTILAFTSRASRDQFVSWFETYRERYPDRNTTAWRVPPIRQGRTGGCFADRKEFTEIEVVQVWAWIIGHCAGSAAFLSNFILFDNENDAVAYRLRWG
jgi:hypothetical protein